MSWYKKKSSNDSKVTPRCRAYMTETVTVPAGGALKLIPMSAIEYDTDNIHTSDATKFQINTPGLYLIVHQEYMFSNLDKYGSIDPKYAINTAFSVNVLIMKNGNIVIGDMQPSWDGNVSALVYLNAGDYIQPGIFIQGETEMTFGFGDTWHPYISIAKVGD
jgi:hypothetical protein